MNTPIMAISYRTLRRQTRAFSHHQGNAHMAKKARTALVPLEQISTSILLLRGRRVILDRDLAALYGVSTGRLNEAVKRNVRRFPEDFMFQLTLHETASLRSQIAISNRGGQRYHPYAFTEHGAIQAANVLNSAQAIEMGIFVVRAFVKQRELLASNKELARRLDVLEARIDKKLTAHDETIAAALSAIRELMEGATAKPRSIKISADLKG